MQLSAVSLINDQSLVLLFFTLKHHCFPVHVLKMLYLFSLFFPLNLSEFPSKKRVIPKCLYNDNNRLFIEPENFEYFLASMFENPVSLASPHSIDNHPGQPERYFFREYTSHFIDLKAITEINVNYFPSVPLYHDVEGMSISQTYYVSDNGHHSETSDETRSVFQPFFTCLRSFVKSVLQIIS